MEQEEQNNEIKKIAFVTQSRIGDGGQYKNGIMNGKSGEELHIIQFGEIGKSIESIKILEKMDYTFMYIPKSSSANNIALTKNIPLDKITYVMCKCKIENKLEALEYLNKLDATIIYSECGGEETLERLLKQYL